MPLLPPPISPQIWSPALRMAHHAVQIPSMVARSYLPHSEEDLQANLGWSSTHQALLSYPIPEGGSLQIGLHIATLTLLIVESDSISQRIELAGKTWGEAQKMLLDVLTAKGFDPAQFSDALPYSIPDFPMQADAVFAMPEAGSAFEALAGFYEMAHQHLQTVADQAEGASAVRCWPHHFDIATLISLPGQKSIGIGLSPGDETFPAPYFYTNPWPHPELEKTPLPLLTDGLWYSENWLGAVLLEEDLRQADDPTDMLERYQQEAMQACRELLAI